MLPNETGDQSVFELTEFSWNKCWSIYTIYKDNLRGFCQLSRTNIYIDRE
jgi:hypothetical protein